MPADEDIEQWIARNEAARAADREADRLRSKSDLLEETVRLSVALAELRENAERSSDVRPA